MCNPHPNYMHITGYPVQHGDSLHFLWGKHLQCIVITTQGSLNNLIKIGKQKSKHTIYFKSETMEATTTEKFYSKSSIRILKESIAVSKEKSVAEKSTVNKQSICPFCYCQVLNLDEHFKSCENYTKALLKERCPLCNDKLKEGPNKKYHWKYKCQVLDIMKESGKNYFLEIENSRE